jgi:hypothetical protein
MRAWDPISQLLLGPLCGCIQDGLFSIQGTGERRYELSCCSETTQKVQPFVAHRQSYAIVDSFGILNTMGLTLSQRARIFSLIRNSVPLLSPL